VEADPRQRFDRKEDGMSIMDDYTIEIDETDPLRVVLIVRTLWLIVLGQTLADARTGQRRHNVRRRRNRTGCDTHRKGSR
jgi:hypothetical protein